MPFNSKEFKEDLNTKDQTLSLLGIGAHHQNGVAERAIQTVTQWARTILLHQVLHWPDQSKIDLWPFALEHAVYVWNHLPRKDIFIAPVELFTGATFVDYDHIQRARVWCCPVHVLQPRLQDGKKLPKWDPRSRRGMFVGMSQSHSSNVGMILNLRTGNVSPQYHVVYDDLFTTVPNGEAGGILNDMPFDHRSWSQILESGWERRIDPVDEASSGTRFVPSLDREWLSDDELPPSVTDHENQPEQAAIPPEPPPPPAMPPSASDNVTPPTRVPSLDAAQAPPLSTFPEGATSPSEGRVYRDPVPDSVSSDPVLSDAQQGSSSRSQYWNEELP
jgi:hypothetical protein